MGILDVFRVGAIKAERDSLRAVLDDVDVRDLVAVREAVAAGRRQLQEAETAVAARRGEAAKLDAELAAKRALVVETDDRLLLQEFGLFEPKYRLASSADYKAELDRLRVRQKEMVRAGTAFHQATNWTVNGSEAEGRRMIRDYAKLIVRAFNTECDATVEGVKFFNLEPSRARIQKSYDVLNKLGARMSVGIAQAYLDTKLKELDLAFEFQIKKQEEKEEAKKLREQQREEAKLQREIDAAREALAKEERHYRRALATMEARLAKPGAEADRALLEAEIATIRERIGEVEAKRQDVDYRAQNASAGYVYVISNIGAFGEGVFKIGVTRRLEPMDRIDELGDASVPFDFDVHVLVFSDDAYGLELALHRHFATSRLNRVNGRKEFFRGTIEEIEAVLREVFGKPVEVERLAEAAEYRQSLLLGAPHAPEPPDDAPKSGAEPAVSPALPFETA
jgi:uncharacterized protein YlxW (UPF0749 family)